MNEFEALYDSRFHGRWSFAETPPPEAFQREDLLTANVDPIFSRSWTVHLNEWRFTGDVAPGLPGQPPQNQLGFRDVKAIVTWGVDGALENALVDYYPHGNSFTVQAAQVRVGLQALSPAVVGQPVPKLTGFLAPNQSWRANPAQSPTFTPLAGLVNTPGGGVPGTQIYAIPSRGVAYRWWTNQEIAVGATLSLFQVGRDGTTVTKVDEPGITVIGPLSEPSNAAAWYPIMVGAQFIQPSIVSDDPASQLVAVQFLLDLG